MIIDPRLHRIVAAQPYPLLFATISGAHLYGFPSPDSDFDLRGVHVLPLEIVAGLDIRDETVEQAMVVPPDTSSGLRSPNDSVAPAPSALGGPSPTANSFRQFPTGSSPRSEEGSCAEGRALEMDIVSHDVRKFFRLLLKKNGYVLEQLFSPLIVHTTPEHEELKAICSSGRESAHSSHAVGQSRLTSAATGVITKHHAHHYLGFTATQWKLFEKEAEKRVKPLLYVFRVLLTGNHLMRSGELNANLVELNEEYRLPYVPDLIARKLAGENTTLSDADVEFYCAEKDRLETMLKEASVNSQLPEAPSAATRQALNDLLVRIRLTPRVDGAC